MSQIQLFNPGRDATAVKKETVEAIQRVEENTDDQWKTEALEAVRLTCVEMDTFISDDVWARGLKSTREDRALGPIFMRASRLGWCVKTDRTRPSVRSHFSGKPVWKSLLRPFGCRPAECAAAQAVPFAGGRD